MTLLPSSESFFDIYRERILDILCEDRQLSYAVLSSKLTVIQSSKNFNMFQSESGVETVGSHISNLFFELVGSEAYLDEILQGKRKIYKLDKINRELVDGSITYLSIAISPIERNNPERGLLILVENTSLSSALEQQMIQDRNELRLTKAHLSTANEELLKLNRLKSIFLSIAAHDMRSPLTAMRAYTELARMALPDEIPSQVKNYLLVVESLADILNRLINDFLSIDIIEQGNLKIQPVACNLNALVLEIADIMRVLAKRKNIQLETHLDERLDSIYADPERVQQILYNLIGNAITYTDEDDSVIIETRLESSSIVITVTDHGPGIPETDIPNLFNLYHRTGSARESKIRGLGLGLFIVKSLVDAHNGEIVVNSTLGRGTKFIVQIPNSEGEGL